MRRQCGVEGDAGQHQHVMSLVGIFSMFMSNFVCCHDGVTKEEPFIASGSYRVTALQTVEFVS